MLAFLSRLVAMHGWVSMMRKQEFPCRTQPCGQTRPVENKSVEESLSKPRRQLTATRTFNEQNVINDSSSQRQGSSTQAVHILPERVLRPIGTLNRSKQLRKLVPRERG